MANKTWKDSKYTEEELRKIAEAIDEWKREIERLRTGTTPEKLPGADDADFFGGVERIQALPDNSGVEVFVYANALVQIAFVMDCIENDILRRQWNRRRQARAVREKQRRQRRHWSRRQTILKKRGLPLEPPPYSEPTIKPVRHEVISVEFIPSGAVKWFVENGYDIPEPERERRLLAGYDDILHARIVVSGSFDRAPAHTMRERLENELHRLKVRGIINPPSERPTIIPKRMRSFREWFEEGIDRDDTDRRTKRRHVEKILAEILAIAGVSKDVCEGDRTKEEQEAWYESEKRKITDQLATRDDVEAECYSTVKECATCTAKDRKCLKCIDCLEAGHPPCLIDDNTARMEFKKNLVARKKKEITFRTDIWQKEYRCDKVSRRKQDIFRRYIDGRPYRPDAPLPDGYVEDRYRGGKIPELNRANYDTRIGPHDPKANEEWSESFGTYDDHDGLGNQEALAERHKGAEHYDDKLKSPIVVKRWCSECGKALLSKNTESTCFICQRKQRAPGDRYLANRFLSHMEPVWADLNDQIFSGELYRQWCLRRYRSPLHPAVSPVRNYSNTHLLDSRFNANRVLPTNAAKRRCTELGIYVSPCLEETIYHMSGNSKSPEYQKRLYSGAPFTVREWIRGPGVHHPPFVPVTSSYKPLSNEEIEDIRANRYMLQKTWQIVCGYSGRALYATKDDPLPHTRSDYSPAPPPESRVERETGRNDHHEAEAVHPFVRKMSRKQLETFLERLIGRLDEDEIVTSEPLEGDDDIEDEIVTSEPLEGDDDIDELRRAAGEMVEALGWEKIAAGLDWKELCRLINKHRLAIDPRKVAKEIAGDDAEVRRLETLQGVVGRALERLQAEHEEHDEYPVSDETWARLGYPIVDGKVKRIIPALGPCQMMVERYVRLIPSRFHGNPLKPPRDFLFLRLIPSRFHGNPLKPPRDFLFLAHKPHRHDYKGTSVWRVTKIPPRPLIKPVLESWTPVEPRPTHLEKGWWKAWMQAMQGPNERHRDVPKPEVCRPEFQCKETPCCKDVGFVWDETERIYQTCPCQIIKPWRY